MPIRICEGCGRNVAIELIKIMKEWYDNEECEYFSEQEIQELCWQCIEDEASDWKSYSYFNMDTIETLHTTLLAD